MSVLLGAAATKCAEIFGHQSLGTSMDYRKLIGWSLISIGLAGFWWSVVAWLI